MLLQGRLKLLYSESDPPILFDLGADPDELTDVACMPDYRVRLEEMTSCAREIWDVPRLTARIIKDQNRRRLIDRSHRIGKPPVWDYQPLTDASQQYVRAGKWTTVVEATAHLPLQGREP